MESCCPETVSFTAPPALAVRTAVLGLGPSMVPVTDLITDIFCPMDRDGSDPTGTGDGIVRGKLRGARLIGGSIQMNGCWFPLGCGWSEREEGAKGMRLRSPGAR